MSALQEGKHLLTHGISGYSLTRLLLARNRYISPESLGFVTEDALFEVYQSARASGRDGENELGALFIPVREHASRVIWLTIHEWSPDLAGAVANKILHRIAAFRGDSKFSTWVHRIAANDALSDVRKRKREVSLESLELESVADKVQSSPYNRVFFYEILESLDPDERELVLGRLHGESHTVIAERLGVRPTCIRSRWEELTKKLRREYGHG